MAATGSTSSPSWPRAKRWRAYVFVAAASHDQERRPCPRPSRSSQDAKVVDNACVSLSYIAEASAGSPSLLEALTAGGLVGQALQLVGTAGAGPRRLQQQ